MVDKKGLDADEAHLVASLSEGSPGKALALHEELGEIPRGDLLKGWLGVRSLSLEDMEQWAESLPSDRERLVSVLEVGKTLLRDLVLVKAVQDPSKLIHGDLREKMETIAAQWDLAALLNRMDVLHQTLLAVSPGQGKRKHKTGPGGDDALLGSRIKTLILVVHVKLANGKAEEFDAADLPLEGGDVIIAESEKGQVLGKVLAPPHDNEKRFILKAPKKVLQESYTGRSGPI